VAASIHASMLMQSRTRIVAVRRSEQVLSVAAYQSIGAPTVPAAVALLKLGKATFRAHEVKTGAHQVVH